ncbi:hypothetical protein CCR85_04120 [Rhodothalassium salexigens]|nr:hypothetical protein [Rhodothalassium salexigens]MBK5920047.1 hypothetical protein [Rhodothalassium salexigens]
MALSPARRKVRSVVCNRSTRSARRRSRPAGEDIEDSPLTRKIVSTALVTAAALSLGGCLELQRASTHGYVIDREVVDELRPGVDNKQSVASALGNPTAASTFRDNVWYYIQQRQEKIAFLPEETTRQRVLQFTFDNEGYFEGLERYTLADAQAVAPRGDRTASRGREMGFFEQIFSNIGRFGAAGPGGMAGPGR